MISLEVALRPDAELASDECRDRNEEVNEKAFAVHEKAFGTMLMRLRAETYALWDGRYLSKDSAGAKTQPLDFSANVFVSPYDRINRLRPSVRNALRLPGETHFHSVREKLR